MVSDPKAQMIYQQRELCEDAKWQMCNNFNIFDKSMALDGVAWLVRSWNLRRPMSSRRRTLDKVGGIAPHCRTVNINFTMNTSSPMLMEPLLCLPRKNEKTLPADRRLSIWLLEGPTDSKKAWHIKFLGNVCAI